MKVKSENEVAQLCPTLSDPMDCSLPDSFIHGIFQARVLEWGAIASSERQPRNLQFTKAPEVINIIAQLWQHWLSRWGKKCSIRTESLFSNSGKSGSIQEPLSRMSTNCILVTVFWILYPYWLCAIYLISGKSLELKGQSSQFYPRMSAFHHPFLGDSHQGLTKEHKSRQWAFRSRFLNGEEYNLSDWGTFTMETRWGTQWGTQRDSNSPSDKWMPPLRMAFPARLLSQHLVHSTHWLQLCLPGLPPFKTFL